MNDSDNKTAAIRALERFDRLISWPLLLPREILPRDWDPTSGLRAVERWQHGGGAAEEGGTHCNGGGVRGVLVGGARALGPDPAPQQLHWLIASAAADRAPTSRPVGAGSGQCGSWGADGEEAKQGGLERVVGWPQQHGPAGQSPPRPPRSRRHDLRGRIPHVSVITSAARPVQAL